MVGELYCGVGWVGAGIDAACADYGEDQHAVVDLFMYVRTVGLMSSGS